MLCIKEKFDFFLHQNYDIYLHQLSCAISRWVRCTLSRSHDTAAARCRHLLAILFVHKFFFMNINLSYVCVQYMVEFELEILVHALIVVNSTVVFFYAITRIMMMRYFYSACAFH